MKKLAAVLAMLLVAANAGAATKYVRASGGSTSFAAGTDTSSAITLATFNTNAANGDIAQLLGGNYGTQRIQPVADGLTYRGFSADPNDVTVGALVEDGTRADSSVVVRGVTINGALYLGGGGVRKMARWVVANCKVNGAVQWGNVYASRFDSLTEVYAGRVPGNAGGIFDANVYGSDSTRASRFDTLAHSTFAMSGTSADSALALLHFSGYDNLYNACRFTTTTAVGAGLQSRWVRMNYTMRGEMRDCYLSEQNNFTSGDEAGVFTYKDGVKLFRMVRDTIIIRGQSFGGTMPWILFGQNESDNNPAFWMEGIGGNSFINCYFRNETASVWGVGWTYAGFDGDSLVGNTMLVANGSIETYLSRGSAPAYDWVMSTGTIVDHNLFATFSNNPAFLIQSATANQSVKFTKNIFYAPNYTGSGGIVNFGTAGNWGSALVGPISNDYNLSYGGLSSASHSVSYSGGTSAFGTGTTWYNARSGIGVLNDANSVWGHPIFTDSTLAAFNATPQAGSAALFGPDNYVGPIALPGGGPTTHTITASAGSNGSISPTGTVTVADAADQTFTITPNAHYHRDSLYVDGSSTTVASSYTFSNVTADHTIRPTFAVDTVAITASAGANGSISPTGVTYVSYGGSQSYTITPDGGYHVLSVLVDGVNVGNPTSYTFTNVTTTHTISATFSADSYTLWSQAYPGGTISPSGTTTVASGATQTFTIAATSGYSIGDVLVDGVSIGPVSTYTISEIAASHVIEAYFAATSSYPIVVTQATGGTITPAGTTYVPTGTDQTFTITPTLGYYVRSLIVDGTPVAPATSYTFTSVGASHTFTAAFAQSTSSIYLMGAATGGWIAPSGNLSWTLGTPINFSVIPKPFRRIRSVYVNGVDVGPVTSYTIPSVTANMIVTATFTDSLGGRALAWRRRR